MERDGSSVPILLQKSSSTLLHIRCAATDRNLVLVDGHAGLVHGHQPGRIETSLLSSPPRSRGGHIGAIQLGRCARFSSALGITVPPIVISRVEVIE